MRVLLENATFLLQKIVRIAGIVRVAGIIQGRALYEEIRYVKLNCYYIFEALGLQTMWLQNSKLHYLLL